MPQHVQHIFTTLLQLKKIQLVQYRNYTNNNYSFTKNIIGFCGNNGIGKTNLLDAIYYLAFTKSYFGRVDSSNATHNHSGFRIEGNFIVNNNSCNATAILRENNKKEFLVNGYEYKKLSEHIGKITVVMVTPEDIELVTGSSELRRRFIDIILSQIDSDYLVDLIKYNQILTNRNRLLKQYAQQQIIDDTLLQILSEQLVVAGNKIFNSRQQFLNKFLPMVVANYASIANNENQITLSYNSQLFNDSFAELLQQKLQTDLALQRTTTGIHKDDIDIFLHDNKFKIEASQGQKKSLLFAFKLSEWQILKQHKGFAPILLLDDVFEKLDASRMDSLLQIVSAQKEAQVFITDTHQQRLEQHLSNLQVDYEIIDLNNTSK